LLKYLNKNDNIRHLIKINKKRNEKKHVS
jgi:hypothetical protein